MNRELGKLQKVKDLRSVWQHEATDFTKWLAEEENLNTLGDEIGIDIELVSTEAKTGSFSTDILAVEANTSNKIIIENQLESTDHDHLGKIITYASGHGAETIIWIVKEAREEHRQAIDWLNEHTDEEINIFLCRIELWKIDDSKVAPKFQIVSSPNNWSKTIKGSSANAASSYNQLLYDYWTKVKEEIDENYPIFNSRKPRGGNLYTLNIGSPQADISLAVNVQQSQAKCRILIHDNKELFDHLYESKGEIENELGYGLEWNRMDKRKASNITVIKECDFLDEGNWNELRDWQLGRASEFYEVFADRIKGFK